MPRVPVFPPGTLKMSGRDFLARLESARAGTAIKPLVVEGTSGQYGLPVDDEAWLASPVLLGIPESITDGLDKMKGKDIQAELGKLSTKMELQPESIRRNWIAVFKAIRRERLDEPLDLLRGLHPEKRLSDGTFNKMHWWNVPMPYEDAPKSFCAFFIGQRQNHSFYGVKFLCYSDMEPDKHRAVYGFAHRDEFWIATVEAAVTAARHSSQGGRGKEQVWKDWKGTFWNWSRRRAGVMCEMSVHLEDWILAPAPKPERYTPKEPRFSCKVVDVGLIRLTLRQANDDSRRLQGILDVLLRACVCLADTGRYPREDQEVARCVENAAGSESTPLRQLLERHTVEAPARRPADLDPSGSEEEVDRVLAEFGAGNLAVKARLLEKHVVSKTAWPELYAGVDSSWKKAPATHSLIGGILTLEKKAIKHRPFDAVEKVLEMVLHKRTVVEICQGVGQLVMSRAVHRSSLRDLAGDMKKSRWCTRRSPDWFLPGVSAIRSSHVLAKKFLAPLGFRIFGTSGSKNLCMVRTVAFLLCVHMGKLPPHVWRIGALLSICALVLRGSTAGTSNVKVDRPNSYTLDVPAVAAINEGVQEEEQIEDEAAESVICGPLCGINKELITAVFNAGLEDVVNSYFAKLGKEGSTSLELETGFPYESLQVVPYITGRPLIVGRTVGSLAGPNGEFLAHSYHNRDSYDDKVAVYDVFMVGNNGQRVVGTYLDFHAAAEQSKHTPYIAWWTASKEMGHLEPVVKEDVYKVLEKEMLR